jgi:arylsulfatase A-like enzyme
MTQGFEEFRLYDTDNELIAYDAMKVATRLLPYETFKLRELLPPYSYVPISVLVDDAVDVLATRDPARPLFLYVQPVDPHGPYQAPKRFEDEATDRDEYVGYWSLKTGFTVDDEQLEGLISRYDGEIRYVDSELGRLFGALKAQHLFDDALIIITSDHGEQFQEHGLWRHSNSLYQQLLHVPLIVKYPRQRSAVMVNRTVATIDIVPTILRVLGGQCTDCEGQPLQDAQTAQARPVFAYVMDRDNVRPIMRSVVDGGWKLIQRLDGAAMREELYRLDGDPKETRDLRAAHPEVAARLQHLLQRYETAAGPAPEADRIAIDESDIELLQALGYVN